MIKKAKPKLKLSPKVLSLIILIFAIMILTVMPREINISGNSMYPTYTDGERVTAIPYAVYKIMGNKLEVGDVVVFELPKSTMEFSEYTQQDVDTLDRREQTAIKRIAATPNQKIPYDSILQDNPTTNPEVQVSTPIVYLQENQYYVLGDNTSRSYDSRYFGAIDESQIKYVVQGGRKDGNKKLQNNSR